MKEKKQTNWSGLWNFWLSERPLTLSEVKILKDGGQIDIPVDSYEVNNVITLGFRTAINEMLRGDIGKLEVTHEQLGTGESTPSENDIDLETPDAGTYKPVSSVAVDGNKLNITSFWNVGEAEGNWKEYGVWVNENLLMVRVAINRTVTATSALTINGEITQGI